MRHFNATSCFLVRNFAKMEKFKDSLSGALSHWPSFIWKIIIIPPKLLHMLWRFPGWHRFAFFNWIVVKGINCTYIHVNSIAKAGSCITLCLFLWHVLSRLTMEWLHSAGNIIRDRIIKMKRIWTKITSE